jgi:hypothetical protein
VDPHRTHISHRKPNTRARFARAALKTPQENPGGPAQKSHRPIENIPLHPHPPLTHTYHHTPKGIRVDRPRSPSFSWNKTFAPRAGDFLFSILHIPKIQFACPRDPWPASPMKLCPHEIFMKTPMKLPRDSHELLFELQLYRNFPRDPERIRVDQLRYNILLRKPHTYPREYGLTPLEHQENTQRIPISCIHPNTRLKHYTLHSSDAWYTILPLGIRTRTFLWF